MAGDRGYRVGFGGVVMGWESIVTEPGDFSAFGIDERWMREEFEKERDHLVSTGGLSWYLSDRIAHDRVIKMYLMKKGA